MPREPTVNVVRADDGVTFTTRMVAVRCDAPGCHTTRLVADPKNPGPHAPHHVAGALVDCIGRIIEVHNG